MKKKRLYLIFSLVLTLSISFLAFFVPTVASASGESQTDITSNYIYVLPSVQISRPTTVASQKLVIIPEIYVLFDSNRLFVGICTAIMSSSRNNLNYVRRNFSFVNGARESTFSLMGYTYDSFSSPTNSYNVINFNVTAQCNYVRPSTEFLTFDVGQVSVTKSFDISETSYLISYVLTSNNGATFYLDIPFTRGSSIYDYSFTFSPLMLVGGLTGQNYQLGYENGYDKGYSNGEDYGYENGLRDGGILTNQSFVSLITAVVDVPINSFKSLLNFNLLGIDLLDFVLSVITFLLVLKVCALFMG